MPFAVLASRQDGMRWVGWRDGLGGFDSSMHFQQNRLMTGSIARISPAVFSLVGVFLIFFASGCPAQTRDTVRAPDLSLEFVVVCQLLICSGVFC